MDEVGKEFQGDWKKLPDKIDYKDPDTLSRFISPRGRIAPGRVSSVTAKQQRMITKAIKRARFLALLPYLDR